MENNKRLDKECIEDILALTPLQEGMLFHYISQVNSDMYFEQLSLRLEGNIEINKLNEAWNFVIKNNEMLRTVFRWENIEKPLQVVLKENTVDINQYDFSRLPQTRRNALLEELLENDRKEKIDITEKPYRILLCKLSQTEHQMIISNHHIIFDGWSTGVILKELFEAYDYICLGQEPTSTSKVKFKQYINWIQGIDKSKQESFWMQYLEGFNNKTLLPFDNKPSDKVSTHESIINRIPSDIRLKLEDLAKENKTTLASIIYTAWGILLQKYNICEDIVFGITVSGRVPQLNGIENSVGLFINTIPLRVHTYDESTLEKSIKKVDEELKAFNEYQYTPLVDVKKYLKIDGKKDLFNSLVVIENYPIDTKINSSDSKLKINSYSMFERTNFDMTLGVMIEDELIFNFIYDNIQFNKETINALASSYIEILNKMIESLDTSLKDIELLSNEEKELMKSKFKNVDRTLKVSVSKGEYVEASNQIEQDLLHIWCKILEIDRVSMHDNFFDIGGNSVLLIRMHAMINKKYPDVITGTDLFSYPTISKLAKYITDKTNNSKSQEANHKIEDKSHTDRKIKDIAIIGMELKMPMADDVDKFWENLKNGIDCIRPVPKSRLHDIQQALAVNNESTDKLHLGEAAFLDEIDKFDYRYFNISPNEAGLMDPNQRLFLQTAWKAIEDAGYGGQSLVGTRTGVFLGFNSDSEYKTLIRKVSPDSVAMAVPGNVKAIVASRLSYLLDLRGPSINVDTTCSSSLTAVHMACKSIQLGECQQAIVGGVQLHLIPVRQAEIGVEASNGRAKTFDNMADGTGTGEGVAVVLLKPLEKALKNGDNIHGVIKGSAINHDGNSIGITAPNAIAQQDVIIRAWEDAEVEPESITYIEAHGTGTKLGDPIEIDGITKAFSKYTNKKQFCGIGSVKTNIGHLDNASGIAGLIKATLSLKHALIPPSLHFKSPNDGIDFSNSPVYVNTQLSQWNIEGDIRRCGISSFGLSGTNCHMILEEAPVRDIESAESSSEPNIFTLSAKSEAALNELVFEYKQFLTETEFSLNDICFTANTGRGHYEYRIAVVAYTKDELVEKLQLHDLKNSNECFEDGVYYGKHKIASTKSNIEDDEKESNNTYTLNTEVKKVIDKLNTIDKQDKELLSILNHIAKAYVKGADIEWTGLYTSKQNTRVSIPTYIFEKHRCWLQIDKDISSNTKQNIYPLIESCIAEAMDISIYTTDFSVEKYWVLNEHKIDGNAVLVGTTYLEMVMEVCNEIYPNGVYFKDIQFITTLFIKEEEVYEVQLVLKKKKYYLEFYIASKIKQEDNNQTSWTKHVEGKVLELESFDSKTININKLKEEFNSGYIEPNIDNYNLSTAFDFGERWKNIQYIHIGQRELISYLQIPEKFQKELSQYPLHPSVLDNSLATLPLLQNILNINPNGKDGNDIYLPFSYGGVKVYKSFPDRFYSYVRLKGDIDKSKEIVSFDISFCDIDGNSFMEVENYCLKKTRRQSLNIKENKDIFYKLDWIPRISTDIDMRDIDGCVVVLKGKNELCNQTVQRLLDKGHKVVEVEMGSEYKKVNENKFIIREEETCYESLIKEIMEHKPKYIMNMLTVDNLYEPNSLSELDAKLSNGVWSLYHLYKALMKQGLNHEVEVLIFAPYINKVTESQECVIPENATLTGLGKVLNREHANFKCKCIDIDRSFDSENAVEELLTTTKTYQTAYREGKAYVEQLNIYDIEQENERELNIKESGLYVITGGTGGIGLEISKYLASKANIKLALINRTELPNRESWDAILENEQGKIKNKIYSLREIEKTGSQVMLCKADITNEAEMSRILENLRNKHGDINGIIHCAGVAGEGLIINKSQQQFKEVLKSKVHGTWILNKHIHNDSLDFFIMCSSNNTLMGMPGQGDYTAANSYLDSFAHYRNINQKNTITINWPAWKETGMAFDYGVNVDGLMKTITNNEAINAFEQVLDKNIDRVIVGEFNPLGSVYGISLESGEANISEEILRKLRKKSKKALPQQDGMKEVLLTGKESEEYTEVEKEIGGIWREVLGYEEFSVNDSFFDIGGDSISITKVHSLLQQKYPEKIQMGELFAYPTILKLGNLIQGEEEDEPNNEEEALNNKSEEEIEQSILDMFEEIEKGNVDIENIDDIMKKFNE